MFALPVKLKAVPSKVSADSASNVFAVPEPVMILLFALLLNVVCVIPFKFDPSPYKASKYPYLKRTEHVPRS